MVSLTDDVIAVRELLQGDLDGGVPVHRWAGHPELYRGCVERDHLSAEPHKPIPMHRRVLECKWVGVPASKGHGGRHLPAIEDRYQCDEHVGGPPNTPNPTARPEFITFGRGSAWWEFSRRS